MRKSRTAYVTAELGNLLVKAAIAKCDAIDGVKDGVIDDPRKCDFDPAELQCKGGSAAGLPQARGGEAREVAVRPEARRARG